MKHVLITGGSDGLGKITAQKLLKAGYKVTILADHEDKTKSTAEKLNCSYVVADVADSKAAKQAIDKSGQVDILINNAGIWIQGPLEENDPARIKRVLEVNALGAINCTQAVIPQMKKRKTGRIINISSQGGLYAKAERGAYTTSKWALTGFSRAMQAELKPFGISVVGLFPAAMDTAIFVKAKNTRDMSKALNPTLVADAIVYICNLPDGVNVTEFGIESLAY